MPGPEQAARQTVLGRLRLRLVRRRTFQEDRFHRKSRLALPDLSLRKSGHRSTWLFSQDFFVHWKVYYFDDFSTIWITQDVSGRWIVKIAPGPGIAPYRYRVNLDLVFLGAFGVNERTVLRGWFVFAVGQEYQDF